MYYHLNYGRVERRDLGRGGREGSREGREGGREGGRGARGNKGWKKGD